MQGRHDIAQLTVGELVEPHRRLGHAFLMLTLRLQLEARRRSQESLRRSSQLAPQAPYPLCGRPPPVRVAQRRQARSGLFRIEHPRQPPASGTSRKNNTSAPSERSTVEPGSTSCSPTKTLKM